MVTETNSTIHCQRCHWNDNVDLVLLASSYLCFHPFGKMIFFSVANYAEEINMIQKPPNTV